MPIKVGFVLLSPSAAPIPSTRIAALNMFAFLREAGFAPEIVLDPEAPVERPPLAALAPRLIGQGFRIVVLQKVHGPEAEQLARALRAAGIMTVWLVCDLVEPSMAAAVEATIVVTRFLKSLYPVELHERIHVVHDGVEQPELHKSDWGELPAISGNPLKAVLVTSATMDEIPVLGTPPRWLDLTIVGRYPPEADRLARLRTVRWQFLQKKPAQRLSYLRFVLDRRIHCAEWTPKAACEAMLRADVGIIPIDTSPEFIVGWRGSDWKVKSENRLTMKMSMALPVVATPIPSYEDVVETGVNGFLARSRRDWLEYLDALREPALRRAIGRAARESVLERYSMQEQARKLIEVLLGLMRR